MEAAKKAHPFAWLVQYLRESKEELEKVAWPSRRDTVRYSLLVIGISVGLAAAIAGADWLLSYGFNQLVAAAKG